MDRRWLGVLGGIRPHLAAAWAVKRSTSQAFSVTAPYRSISDPVETSFQVLGPGQFQQ